MRHRSLSLLRGSPAETAQQAWEQVAGLPEAERLWVSAREETGPPGVAVQSPRQVQRRLGTSCSAVVLDLHGGFDGDTLGRVHGFLRGGGRLLLRLPPPEEAPTDRMWARLERALAGMPCSAGALRLPEGGTGPSEEQDALVARLRSSTAAPEPRVTVLQADRGRGKSAALGRLLAERGAGAETVLTGPSAASVGEVQRFAGPRPVAWQAPLEVLAELEQGRQPELVVVDEAAQLPVPLLQALVRAAPGAHLIFSTTVHGYEGTGRGFGLRFVEWLRGEARPVVQERLRRPIRWDPGDPLERFVFELLLLEAAPVDLAAPPQESGPQQSGQPGVGRRGAGGTGELRFERVDRTRLSEQEDLLKGVFGLLVAAHYRTTPGDLHRMLDGEDTALHVGWLDGQPVAVGWLVAEGGLEASVVADILRGRRLRGQVLPETLCSHGGHPEAGALRMWRSVRTAVHPALRRRGLARQLVEWEHGVHREADLLGTAFGATPELLRFRRSLGYRLVRLGVSRSARTGVPSAVMLWPRSEAAHRLVESLRGELARDLPAQLEQMDRERGVPLSPALRGAVLAGLPEPAEWTSAGLDARIRSYVAGSNPLDVLGPAPRTWLLSLPEGAVAALPGVEGQAVRARVAAGGGWPEVQAATGLPTVPAAQRAVRRGMRRLYGLHGREELSPGLPATTPSPC